MKWILPIIAVCGILYLTNPDELAHKAAVKAFMLDYTTQLNAPFLNSGNADSTARGLRAQEGMKLMADGMIQEMYVYEDYRLFSFLSAKNEKGTLGILGKVYWLKKPTP